jgi:hypothetical protein
VKTAQGRVGMERFERVKQVVWGSQATVLGSAKE